MKHYTSQIPLPLAEKLKEKGMPIEEGGKSIIDWKVPTYAGTIDWLMSRGVPIYIRPCYLTNGDLGGWQPCYRIWGMKAESTWHEAAEKAIERALELI